MGDKDRQQLDAEVLALKNDISDCPDIARDGKRRLLLRLTFKEANAGSVCLLLFGDLLLATIPKPPDACKPLQFQTCAPIQQITAECVAEGMQVEGLSRNPRTFQGRTNHDTGVWVDTMNTMARKMSAKNGSANVPALKVTLQAFQREVTSLLSTDTIDTDRLRDACDHIVHTVSVWHTYSAAQQQVERDLLERFHVVAEDLSRAVQMVCEGEGDGKAQVLCAVQLLLDHVHDAIEEADTVTSHLGPSHSPTLQTGKGRLRGYTTGSAPTETHDTASTNQSETDTSSNGPSPKLSRRSSLGHMLGCVNRYVVKAGSKVHIPAYVSPPIQKRAVSKRMHQMVERFHSSPITHAETPPIFPDNELPEKASDETLSTATPDPPTTGFAHATSTPSLAGSAACSIVTTPPSTSSLQDFDAGCTEPVKSCGSGSNPPASNERTPPPTENSKSEARPISGSSRMTLSSVIGSPIAAAASALGSPKAGVGGKKKRHGRSLSDACARPRHLDMDRIGTMFGIGSNPSSDPGQMQPDDNASGISAVSVISSGSDVTEIEKKSFGRIASIMGLEKGKRKLGHSSSWTTSDDPDLKVRSVSELCDGPGRAKGVARTSGPMALVRRSPRLTRQRSHEGMPEGMPLEMLLSQTLDTSIDDQPMALRSPLYQHTVQDIVLQLSFNDHQLLSAIEITEFTGCRWSKAHKHERAPNIVAAIGAFNKVAMWVAATVLAADAPLDRARIIERYVQIAEGLMHVSNYNGLKAVVCGLQCQAVYRLRQSWGLLAPSAQRTLDALCALVAEDANYKIYREVLKVTHGPKLPYLGVYLTDITYTADAFRSNEAERDRLVHGLAQSFLSCVSQPWTHPPAPSPQVATYLSTAASCSPDEAYALSLLREPIPVRRSASATQSDGDGLKRSGSAGLYEQLSEGTLREELGRLEGACRELHVRLGMAQSGGAQEALLQEVWDNTRRQTRIRRRLNALAREAQKVSDGSVDSASIDSSIDTAEDVDESDEAILGRVHVTNTESVPSLVSA